MKIQAWKDGVYEERKRWAVISQLIMGIHPRKPKIQNTGFWRPNKSPKENEMEEAVRVDEMGLQQDQLQKHHP